MDAPVAASTPPRSRWGLRFSLKTLLLVMLLVAVWFGGRASLNWRFALAPNLTGSWVAAMPAGWQQPTTISSVGNGQYVLSSRAILFNGTYAWENGQLVMVTPGDPSMAGLVWKWDGQRLLLVTQPNNRGGSSYVGTVLSRVPAK